MYSSGWLLLFLESNMPNIGIDNILYRPHFQGWPRFSLSYLFFVFFLWVIVHASEDKARMFLFFLSFLGRRHFTCIPRHPSFVSWAFSKSSFIGVYANADPSCIDSICTRHMVFHPSEHQGGCLFFFQHPHYMTHVSNSSILYFQRFSFSKK